MALSTVVPAAALKEDAGVPVDLLDAGKPQAGRSVFHAEQK
ncbi:hypothetical protein [Massilia pseudoviolaceinigra]|nr:hypothetical protein [Massilia sp. CCM 9206]MDQ1920768.1 hypothetical protein [Massilia sp. CCM 9206]